MPHCPRHSRSRFLLEVRAWVRARARARAWVRARAQARRRRSCRVCFTAEIRRRHPPAMADRSRRSQSPRRQQPRLPAPVIDAHGGAARSQTWATASLRARRLSATTCDFRGTMVHVQANTWNFHRANSYRLVAKLIIFKSSRGKSLPYTLYPGGGETKSMNESQFHPSRASLVDSCIRVIPPPFPSSVNYER